MDLQHFWEASIYTARMDDVKQTEDWKDSARVMRGSVFILETSTMFMGIIVSRKLLANKP
jgi:hypothetical protein